MSYPTSRQDFEGGTTLGTACPELIDFGSAFAIDSSGTHALTGTNSLKETTFTSSQNIFNNVNDSLGGNVTFSAYIQNGSSNASVSIYARLQPAGQQGATTFVRALFQSTGIQLIQDNAGTLSNLNTAISGFGLPVGAWLCLELRCDGTSISSRVVRQDTGQFFVHSGSGSWSSVPQTVTGTATISGAGGIGFRGGDNTFLYLDDWIVDPAVPSIDVTSFSLSGAGATQPLTAGGFTDPLFGVTWSSSNTSVATVNSAGLVTAVAAGSAAITATGKRDSGQTASSSVTVTSVAATGYTLTAPTPSSGYANNVSQNFTVKPNGNFTGSVAVALSGGGLSGTVTLNWFSSSASQTFTIAPTSVGTVTLTPTNSASLPNASAVTYTVNPQGFSVSPGVFFESIAAPSTFTGTGTKWTTSAPVITATGTAGTGTSVGSITVISDTSATATITPGTTIGAMTFHDSTTLATVNASVATAPTTWPYLASVVGFSTGLVGQVGYAVIRGDGSTYAVRTTVGVFAMGLAGYAAIVPLPLSGSYAIVWDDGAGHFTFEVVNPVGVEPASAMVPGGINLSQNGSLLLAALTSLVSGYTGNFPATVTFKAPDQATTRIRGTVDGQGNRVTPITLSPPL